jgi:hypothetical protein
VSHPIDGGLFDALTLIIGLIVLVSKLALRWYFQGSSSLAPRSSTVDLFNGCLIFPFVALLMMPILLWLDPIISFPTLSNFLLSLKNSNPGSLGLAGGAGLFFVLGELSKFD